MTDNPALCAAVATGRPVIPLYILDQSSDGLRPMGGASLWWLHGSLESMGHHLQNLGAPLTLKKGAAKEVLGQLIAETGADTVYWNRCYEPGAIARDKAIKNTLQNDGLYAKSFNGSLLYEPWEIRTKQDKPYRMFTPFYRMVLSQGTPIQPLPKPKQIIPCDVPPKSDYLDDWSLQPTRPNWAASFPEFWSRGELGAQTLLSDFLNGGVAAYKTERDFPGVAATSRLSPHLHFGDISPRQIWASASTIEPTAGSETFLKEVVWREFGYHLLYYNPAMTTAPLQTKFNAFPWAKNDSHLVAWKTGQTGYPMIDAGMRELWATGTMHNRVRMVVASFLVKHLLIHWREGEAWFWDALVDADLASNSANWQWVSGCGADAAPYFRIFNPITQGERFDADGTYVRRWVPEIAGVSNQYIHKPWDAPKATLLEAGVSLGDTYPRPIVDHKVARKKALAALASIKQAD